MRRARILLILVLPIVAIGCGGGGASEPAGGATEPATEGATESVSPTYLRAVVKNGLLRPLLVEAGATNEEIACAMRHVDATSPSRIRDLAHQVVTENEEGVKNGAALKAMTGGCIKSLR